MEINIELILLFFLIATLYGSVGFGGGSSYLAILSLFGIDYLLLRATALLCNITVVSGSSFVFYRKGLIKWKKLLPVVILSVPMAYLGGSIQINERPFFILLGIALIIASILILAQKKMYDANIKFKHLKEKYIFNMTVGASIGFISGMVGIGGGIFLAPVLHLMKWDSPKVIAATAAFFIFVNSVAGLLGQWSNPGFYFNYKFILPLLITVFIGGQIGVRLGTGPFKPNTIKLLTACLIAFVGLRILFKQFI